VIVKTYLTWRIENPLDFYVTLKDPAEAQRQLSSRLREIRGLISRYRLDQLVNLDKNAIKLAEIEDQAKATLEKSLAQSGYGLKVESVGIYKIVLPESTTQKVFETMITTRERLSENALQEGQAQASAIRSEAESARERILAFAERRAQTIRSKGDREASKEYESFAANEDFAVFLRKVEALKKMLDHNTTFVLSADSLGILDWFNRDPGQSAPAGSAATAGPGSSLPRPRAARWTGSSGWRSITSTRLGTPTWIAARPMPGASYIVSNMSATSWRRSSPNSRGSTGVEMVFSRGSGTSRISRIGMIVI
jgi:hypothetical protein